MSNPELVWSFCGQNPTACSSVFPCKGVVLFLYDQLNRVRALSLLHKRRFLSIRVAAGGEGGRLWPWVAVLGGKSKIELEIFQR